MKKNKAGIDNIIHKAIKSFPEEKISFYQRSQLKRLMKTHTEQEEFSWVYLTTSIILLIGSWVLIGYSHTFISDFTHKSIFLFTLIIINILSILILFPVAQSIVDHVNHKENKFLYQIDNYFIGISKKFFK